MGSARQVGVLMLCVAAFGPTARAEHVAYWRFEGLALEGQRVAGVCNRGSVLSLRHVTSRNRVPAVHNDKGGGLVHPVGIVPADLPMFINAGRLSLICCVTAPRSDHQIYVQETRGSQTRRLPRAHVAPEGGRRKIHLYVGYTK